MTGQRLNLVQVCSHILYLSINYRFVPSVTNLAQIDAANAMMLESQSGCFISGKKGPTMSARSPLWIPLASSVCPAADAVAHPLLSDKLAHHLLQTKERALLDYQQERNQLLDHDVPAQLAHFAFDCGPKDMALLRSPQYYNRHIRLAGLQLANGSGCSTLGPALPQLADAGIPVSPTFIYPARPPCSIPNAKPWSMRDATAIWPIGCSTAAGAMSCCAPLQRLFLPGVQPQAPDPVRALFSPWQQAHSRRAKPDAAAQFRPPASGGADPLGWRGTETLRPLTDTPRWPLVGRGAGGAAGGPLLGLRNYRRSSKDCCKEGWLGGSSSPSISP